MSRNRTDPAYAVIGALSVCHLLNDMMQSLLPAIYPILKSRARARLPADRPDHARQPAHRVAAAAGGRLSTPIAGRSRTRSRSAWDSRCRAVAAGRAPTHFGWRAASAAALVGVGSSIFHPESSRIARMASGGRHGLAQSLFQVGGNAGSSLGPLLAAFVVLPRGQRQRRLVRDRAADGDRRALAVGVWYRAHVRARGSPHGGERTRRSISSRGVR